DEDVEPSEPLVERVHEPARLFLHRDVRPERDGIDAQLLGFCRDLLRLLRAAAEVDGNVETVPGQAEQDRPAHALCGARHQSSRPGAQDTVPQCLRCARKRMVSTRTRYTLCASTSHT